MGQFSKSRQFSGNFIQEWELFINMFDYQRVRNLVLFFFVLFVVTEPSSMKIDMGVKHGQTIKTMGTDSRNECWLVMK